MVPAARLEPPARRPLTGQDAIGDMILPMPATVEELRRRFAAGPLVLDGATGTELERRGAGAPALLWSAAALVSAPQVVAAIHREYVEAGADLVTTNTFRTNPRSLRKAGLLSEGPAMNRLAVQLAREAAGPRPVLVAASLGPVEDCYCPERVPAEDALRAEHEQMVAWLAAAQPDLIWIETIGTVREARAAVEAAFRQQMPFVVSFVVQESGKLLGGEQLEEAVAAVEPLGPLALGLNCIPPRGMTDLLPRLRRATAGPVAAYAHIGNATPIRGWSYGQDVTPTEYADYARQWFDQGAAIVGGCCGTTPAHIQAVRAALPRS
jgi:S-methylmethionine-dependent homocysteine/selenocysteine methylase